MTRHRFTRTLIATLGVPAILAASPSIAIADQNNAVAPDAPTIPVERKLVLGLGSSIRVPVAHQEPFNEHVFVPVALTFSGALSRRLRAGAVVEFAPSLGGRCSSSSCRAFSLRTAAELELKGVAAPATPWAAVGIGFQHLIGNEYGGDYFADASTTAPTAHAQAGFDFGTRATFGPFVFAAADAYDNRGTYVGQERLAIHGWLGAGVRATLGL
ncbi:MAG: hypothetical protein IPG50_35245 [Myxococcales bacterium]|nr:hypothetical protein [Myxococcales bacterium]